MRRIICNGKLVTPSGVIESGSIVIENGIIVDIRSDSLKPESSEDTDATGRWVLPGLIDTHSDAIEMEILPRANGGLFPLDIAFIELEKKMASQGMTTVYHALSIAENVMKKSLRNPETIQQILETIENLTSERKLIHHRTHLRCEVTRTDLVPFIEKLISENTVHQLSFTDHTPGQGQYRDMEEYRNIWKKRMKGSEEEINRIAEESLRKEKLSNEQLRSIANMAYRNHIPIASHDDDSIEKVERMQQLYAVISEFPVHMEVAQEAKRRGMYVVMGAPNVLLGRSHSNNLSAREAIREGWVDILCSDYYPASLLQSIFQLVHLGYPVSLAVNLVSLNPAKALGIEDKKGSLEVGKEADILIVDERNKLPYVEKVLVSGKTVCQMSYIRNIRNWLR